MNTLNDQVNEIKNRLERVEENRPGVETFSSDRFYIREDEKVKFNNDLVDLLLKVRRNERYEELCEKFIEKWCP